MVCSFAAEVRSLQCRAVGIAVLIGGALCSDHVRRPCFHYGRQSETEAAEHPGQQWVSFYSGDATVAAASYGVGVGLAILRRRPHTRVYKWVGGAVAAVGSLLRVVAYMHWATDVLVGVAVGFALGFGPPLLLARMQPAPTATTQAGRKDDDDDDTLLAS